MVESEANRAAIEKKEKSLHEFYVRFSGIERIEHLLVMVLFTTLVITGLPQKFYEASWARWVIQFLGGIDPVRWVHRFCGFLFAFLAVWHLGRAGYQVIRSKAIPYILPRVKDFRDVIVTLRYYLGLSEEEAKFDRFDFRQKFEYLGLLLGSLMMISTGLILLYPVFFTSFLPGIVIPAAKTAHSYEAFMAFLVIIIWHMYGAHFSPEIFPGDTSIFTGRISRERLEKEHPLEYERIRRSSLLSKTPPTLSKAIEDGESAPSAREGKSEQETSIPG